MSRTVERLIDLAATATLLLFAWLFKESQPTLAGAVCFASIAFWLTKNAQAPDSLAHQEGNTNAANSAARVEATALAAAEVIKTALAAAATKTKVDQEATAAAASTEVTAHG